MNDIGRPITIHIVLNGYIAEVGCQTIVLQSKQELLRELSAYLDNPGEVERRYLTQSCNAVKQKDMGLAVAETAGAQSYDRGDGDGLLRSPGGHPGNRMR